MQQTTQNPYEHCPTFESGRFILRLVKEADARDLLACYADPLSAPIFNSDNCSGNFVFQTEDEIRAYIRWWLVEYAQGGYVRFAIVDRGKGVAVGTIECFARPGEYGGFGRMGLLRLDLASPYENQPALGEILEMVEAHLFDAFGVQSMITKAIPAAGERVAALLKAGYRPLEDVSVIAYGGYWVKAQ